jgi:hypothetical protein
MRPMILHEEEPGIGVVRGLVREMLAADPEDRPFPLDLVETALRDVQPG